MPSSFLDSISIDFVVPSSVAYARSIQNEMRQKLSIEDEFDEIENIAGVDVGYDNARGLAHASVVILRAKDLVMIEHAQAFTPVDFPYIPGLLAFREIPAILTVLGKISTPAQMFMVDGQGIAHPRRMGIAAHLGVLLDMPSIGVAKSHLTGNFENPGRFKGDISPLMISDEMVGTVLRSKEKSNPLFISPGHRVSVKTALQVTLQCLTSYRLPEPTRLADKLSKVQKAPVLEPNLI